MFTTTGTKRLLVSHRDPVTGSYSTVGELSHDGEAFVFTYAATSTRDVPGLRRGQSHRSQTLFPIFAERIMHPRRPDRAESLAWLGLPPDADPFEVLAISGGRRMGDTYELSPLPEPGPVQLPFLVHGIRHVPGAAEAIDQLQEGQQLGLAHEPTNVVNGRALLVVHGGNRLGYVPDPLLAHVHQIVACDHELVIERINPTRAGVHMRLLVMLTGHLPG